MSRAQRVQQGFDLHLEEGLFRDLHACLEGGPADRQLLGDPQSIVLESDLVVSLATRLRSAAWAKVVAVPRGEDAQKVGARSALLLVNSVLTTVHNGDGSGCSGVQPRPHVLQALVRQVCMRCKARWGVDHNFSAPGACCY